MLDDIKRKGTISEIIKRLSAVEGHVRKILGTVNTNIGPTGPTGAPGADGADGVNGNDGAPGVVALFDYIADQNNSGTTETDLYASTIAAGQLSQSKKLIAKYGGTFVASPTATRQLRVYFGGTAIFDSGAIPSTAASAWSVEVFIIAVSGTVIRYSVYLITNPCQ